MPRKFNLTNKNGEVYDLNLVGHAFYNPEGLGWAEETSVVRLGESWLVTDNRVAKPSVSGEIVFHGYQEYNDFLRFVQLGGLVLGYMPLSTWRYLNCTIQLSKSEIKPFSKLLICPVVFNGTSQWYERATLQPSAGTIPSNAKLYDYPYPYAYAQGEAGSITINNGVLSSYFRLQMNGLVENPVWRLYVNGQVVHSGKVNATISLGHSFVVNTRPTQMEIAEYDGDENLYRDLYGYSDFSTERLFMIPAGESMLMVADDNGTPDAYVEVYRRV